MGMGLSGMRGMRGIGRLGSSRSGFRDPLRSRYGMSGRFGSLGRGGRHGGSWRRSLLGGQRRAFDSPYDFYGDDLYDSDWIDDDFDDFPSYYSPYSYMYDASGYDDWI
ncbi:hypothetical protein P152DRAFT_459293 [Eremomyces bilateralis CBS 781.70]|uniref:Uncharacterized protein n=1 Tax=Eremomyces bilateralis CBS 781.70 TaxID=1392243 RepID=A0A6G1G1F4_9PEZI|nr:uncharacterized protein P152DRAFT_459293 [Eremomyces bilateralis CBS 781.70]KAF1811812.1 hypothetical protein P152DRAFT_459293 [Eremomyces bilateralis CBS 781.70]